MFWEKLTSTNEFFGIDEAISKKHCQTQFAMLKGEYETLFESPGPRGQPGGQAPAPALAPAAQTIKEIIEQNKTTPDSVGWPMIYKFHRCILFLSPDAELKRAAWALRERYREMFGEREYANYLASKPPELDGTGYSREALLSDMDRLLEIIYANYAMEPDNTWLLRRRVRATMITIGIGLTALGLLLGLVFFNHPVGATALTVGVVGSMGGFVSILQRLRQLGGSGDALTDYHEIQSVRYTSIFAAGVTGALFAGVLYMFFAGALIQGQLFPTFTPVTVTQPQRAGAAGAQPSTPTPQLPASATKPAPGGSQSAAGAAAQPAKAPPSDSSEGDLSKPAAPSPATSNVQTGTKPTVYSFLEDRRPQEPKDVALLVLWAFLAGFFERLVPDQLKQLLAKKAELQA